MVRVTVGKVVVLACSSAVIGCSNGGSDDEGGGTGCGHADCPVDTASVDLDEPRVTFLGDLMSDDPKRGIFRRACNSTACHGRVGSGNEAELYLGPNLSNTTNTTIDDALCRQVVAALAAPSKTLGHMPNVTPFEPETSFLMLKVDGCQNASSIPACATDQLSTLQAPCCTVQPGALQGAGPCGNSMPRLAEGDILCSNERDTIRRWIAQGAPCN